MKKGVVALMLILVLFSSSVFALDVAISPVKDKFFPGEEVRFSVVINNEGTSEQTYVLKTLSYDWVVTDGGGSVNVPGRSTKEFIMSFRPRLNKEVGQFYNIDLLVKKGNTDLVEKLVTVELVDRSKVLDASVLNKEIDPRKQVALQISLKNLYSFSFGRLTFTAVSDAFNVSRVVSVSSDESQTLSFDININPQTLEGIHNITFKAIDGNGVLHLNQVKIFNVMKYSDIQEIVVPDNSFLVYGEKVTETNTGNDLAEKTYSKELSGFAKLFTSFNPAYTTLVRVDDGKYKLSWVVPLVPGEVKNIEYKTDYLTPLLIILLIIAIFVFVYVWVISPVSIRKKVVTLHSRKGNIAIMKVMISVRNNRRLPLHNLSVIDRVPKIIKSPTEFGLERPSASEIHEDGTKFSWHIPTLAPGQEKVYSYKIESNIKVLGDIRLPSAVAVIRKGMKKRVVRSSSVVLREE